MTDAHRVELFVLKCAVIENTVRQIRKESLPDYGDNDATLNDDAINVYIRQFDIENRTNASKMAKYYRIFYMLENDIRKLIVDTLESAHGADWWDKCASQGIKDEVKKNRTREENAAISLRSLNEIDYTTFGQLGDLIRDNWTDFAGMMRN